MNIEFITIEQDTIALITTYNIYNIQGYRNNRGYIYIKPILCCSY